MPEHPNVYIHPSSVVDEPCEIGEGTKIWHFSHVMKEARIGRGCSIGQNVFVGRAVEIGNGCKIQNNVSVYEGVTLEDHVFCGPSVVFTNVINPRSELSEKASLDRRSSNTALRSVQIPRFFVAIRSDVMHLWRQEPW